MTERTYTEEQEKAASVLRERLIRKRRGVLRLDDAGERQPYKIKKRVATEAIVARLDFLPREQFGEQLDINRSYQEIDSALESLSPDVARLIGLETIKPPAGSEKSGLYLDLRRADLASDSLKQAGFKFETGATYLIHDNTDGAFSRTMLLAFPQSRWLVCLSKPTLTSWAKAEFPKLTFLTEEEARPDRLGTGSLDGVVGLSLLQWPEAAALEALSNYHRAIRQGGFLFVTTNGYAEILARLERKKSVGFLRRCFSSLEQSGFFCEERPGRSTDGAAADTFASAAWFRDKLEGPEWQAAFARSRCPDGRRDAYVFRRL